MSVGITEFPVPTVPSDPLDITRGPDGNLWFTESNLAAHKLGRITPDGVVTEFTLPDPNASAYGITSGPDGNLWFTESSQDLTANPIVIHSAVGRLTPDGQFTEFALPDSVGSGPNSITAGPDGNLWFVNAAADQIGRITTSGSVSFFAIPTSHSNPSGIAAGPDGNVWFTEGQGFKVGRVTPDGKVTEFALPLLAPNSPIGIVTGPDGNLWITQDSYVGRVTPDGVVTEFALPDGRGASAITLGPDGNLWITQSAFPPLEPLGVHVARITPAGDITEFLVPSTNYYLGSITSGPDGNLWFAESVDRIGRVTLNAPDVETPAVVTTSAGTPFQGVVASFTDQRAGASDYSATIYWGDGSSSTGTVEDSAGSFQVVGSHTYGGAGGFTVGVVLHNTATNIAIAGLSSALALSPNQIYVGALFHDLLGRAAGAGELTAWGSLLDQGVSRFTVALAIEQSAEGRGAAVQDLYQHLLHRAADAGGLQAFVQYLQQGGTVAQAEAVILGSEEYFQRMGGGTSAGYVAALYHDVLGRSGDGPGAAAWAQFLSGGETRDLAAFLILSSGEGLQTRVEQLFERYLQRDGDLGGLAAFTSAMQAGMPLDQVVAAVVGSQEYYADSVRAA